jgi:hypothetical protein
MKIFISCLCFSIFFCATILKVSIAQTDTSFSLIKSISGNFTHFTADNLENIYLVDINNRLKKLNSNGDSVGVFNEVRKYGKLSSIDASNPLKLLLFYKNFSTVVVLDRFLNIRNVINLRKQNIFKLNTVTTSYDNNIWIFDEGVGKLKKIHDDGSTLLETVDLRTVIDTIPSPNKIIDQDNFVYVYDSTKGFYVFDYYGAYKNKIPYLNWKSVEVFGKTLLGIGDNCIYQYEIGSFNLKEFAMPIHSVNPLQSKISNNKLYLLNENGLEVYRIK